MTAKTAVATFAAGCFWGVQLHFQRMQGVLGTSVGYTNGHVPHPTYDQVCAGTTGHAEAVRVQFDPSVVSYDELLDKFWSIHDPTTLNRQKFDIGTQYRSGIYYHSEAQREAAEASKAARVVPWSLLGVFFGNKIVTEIEPAGEFYPAEEYHQRYLEKGGQCARVGTTDRVRCYG
ncbi:peptide-methionine (S)-S-oxide reductase [Saprolegnia parasitica CBS 223.65]|uniref:peptide-methionine (S)-S-oxide reductase n=1 Tax=Saprolegnia parasitica (strain CBS 223.65) TaxID=695850 RepID=A0A067C0L8_SAPPC|nr:peptide-methionine (S)-S-oxide reductase [Saprolegnia parasitica CBS 223.65]KDO24073.1 peptide-methionine (S)-S-oxide reductase [Saprolegnia parasitica CBS 223.65]|eukprot:XP_012205209.1 peptide-methionine (S)-S-oxide reductase [Saprolegnia parasitica CBS 223.65]